MLYRVQHYDQVSAQRQMNHNIKKAVSTMFSTLMNIWGQPFSFYTVLAGACF